MTFKSASARALFWSMNAPKASHDKQNIREKRFLPSCGSAVVPYVHYIASITLIRRESAPDRGV